MALSNYRIDKLPRSTQIAVISCLLLGLAFVFYLFYLKGPIQERKSLQAEVAKLQASVAQGKAIESQLSRFKKELAELQKRLNELRAILPPQKETPTVLRGVQEMAALNNLKILRFVPQPIVPRAFYVDWPITIEVEGNYNGLGQFFEKIGQYTRIIDVNKISIKGIDSSIDPNRTVTATCTATTFVFREDQVVDAPK